MIANSNIKTLKDLISNNNFVVAIFSTKWCGECIMTNKVLPNVISKLPNVKFIEIDVDKEKLWEEDSKEDIKIKFVPTFIIYKDGKIVAQDSGFKVEKKLIKFIEKNEK